MDDWYVSRCGIGVAIGLLSCCGAGGDPLLMVVITGDPFLMVVITGSDPRVDKE